MSDGDFLTTEGKEVLDRRVGVIEPIVVDMIDQILEAQEPAHRPKKKTTDSVSSSEEGKRRSAGGNSFQHEIRKLRYLAVELPYAAELRGKVFKKEISVNRALVLLGIRPKMVSVIATWEGVANGARSHLELEDIAELIGGLSVIFK